MDNLAPWNCSFPISANRQDVVRLGHVEGDSSTKE